MWGSGHFDLYLQADAISRVEEGLELALYGSAASGWFGGIDLHVTCDDSGNFRSATIPLHLEASSSGDSVRNLNLWVEGCYPTHSEAVELVLWNEESGVQNAVPLFIQGSGVTDGATPFTGSLSLFIRRGASSAIVLHLGAPGEPFTSGTPFYVYGAQQETGVVPLVIPSVLGFQAESVKLYTHGW